MKSSGDWKERYYNKRNIDVMKFLNSNDIELLNKLGITVKSKLYSNYEFDIIEGLLIRYYIDQDMSEEELAESKTLEGTGVTREQYNLLIEKFEKISLDYNL